MKYERTKKSTHLDTVYYEIDMLRYAQERLQVGSRLELPERNMVIECYLLHFRNLLEFFSGTSHRPGDQAKGKTADLSTHEPQMWANRPVTKDELINMQCLATDLRKIFFDKISQYLQHCTERRFIEPSDWDINSMHHELEKVICEFENAFPRPRILITRSSDEISSSTTTFVAFDSVFKDPVDPNTR